MSFHFHEARHAIVAFLSVNAVLLAYSNHFLNRFHSDDEHTIVTNYYVRDISNIGLFFSDASTSSTLPSERTYQPVVTSLNALDYHLAGGLVPVMFHITVFVTYIVLLFLLFLVIRCILDAVSGHGSTTLIAWCATMFYGLHAANADTINSIAARPESFSTFCVIAALYLYQSPEARRRYVHVGAMVLGMLANPAAAVFAPLLSLYIYLFEKPTANELIGNELRTSDRVRLACRKSASAWIGAGVTLVILHQSMVGIREAPSALLLGVDVLPAFFEAVPFQVINFVAPLYLSADTTASVADLFGKDVHQVGVVMALVLVLIAGLSATIRGTVTISYGILWFLLTLIFTFLFTPRVAPASPRTFFLPYVGLVISLFGCLSAGLSNVKRASVQTVATRLLKITIVLVVAIHAYGVVRRNFIWTDSLALWRDAVGKSPASTKALVNYGRELRKEQRYAESLDHLERAMEIEPLSAEVRAQLATTKGSIGRQDEAEALFMAALTYDPERVDTYWRYAEWLFSQGRSADAKRVLWSCLRISPGYTRAHKLLVDVYSSEFAYSPDVQGQTEVVQRKLTPVNYINLSLTYYGLQAYAECIDICRMALLLEPRSEDAYNNICSAYIELGSWDQAIAACSKSLELAPNYQRAKNNLRVAIQGKAANEAQ